MTTRNRRRSDRVFATAPRHVARICNGLLCLALHACSSTVTTPSSSALPQVVLSPSVEASPNVTQPIAAVPVSLSYLLPSQSTAMQTKDARRLQYVSSSNTQLTIGVTPFGSTTTNYGPTACTPISCAVNFTANPGPVSLQFTLTDGSANVLSTFRATSIIEPNTVNTLSFTANPVVTSVQLQLGSSTTNGGTRASIPIAVRALDAAGNVIAGDGDYVDVNGSPVSFSLQVKNNQSGGSGTVTLQGVNRFTNSGQQATYAVYDGQWLADSTISVMSTSTAVSSLTGATLTITPSVAQEFQLPAGSDPENIIKGFDGNLWFTEIHGNNLSSISPSGALRVVDSGSTTSQNVAAGPDGNYWTTNYANAINSVSKIAPNGALTTFTLPLGNSHPTGLTMGSDGNLWVTAAANHYIFRLTTQGMFTPFSLPAADVPNSIVVGPDGALWFTTTSGNTIGRITTSGAFTETATTTPNASPQQIAVGPDGNLWFTEYIANKIGRITPAGVMLPEYPITTSSAGPLGICLGPDGNMWFVERDANQIARITPSGVVSEYSIGATPSSSQYITLGPDGNLWFTELGPDMIGKFVL